LLRHKDNFYTLINEEIWNNSMTFKHKILCAAALILVGFLYAVHNILLPFATAFFIAYFLNPLIKYGARHGISRKVSAGLVVLLFFAGTISLSFYLAPILYKQGQTLVHMFTDHKGDITHRITEFAHDKLEGNEEIMKAFQAGLTGVSHKVVAFSSSLIGGIFNAGFALVNIISLIFITPVITFYLLKDWPQLSQFIMSMIPKKYRSDAQYLSTDIKSGLTKSFKGQTYSCSILALYYVIALTALGLQSGGLIGMMSGFLSFIPYVGFLFSAALSLIVAYIQFGPEWQMLAVAIIYVVGSLTESVILTILVGRESGLHPAWFIFGILAGGSLLGFTGILFALPLTVLTASVVRFGFHKYQEL
jgi:predicted PurR-regulated permease PerM